MCVYLLTQASGPAMRARQPGLDRSALRAVITETVMPIPPEASKTHGHGLSYFYIFEPGYSAGQEIEFNIVKAGFSRSCNNYF
jgi:hypothetical protein